MLYNVKSTPKITLDLDAEAAALICDALDYFASRTQGLEQRKESAEHLAITIQRHLP